MKTYAPVLPGLTATDNPIDQTPSQRIAYSYDMAGNYICVSLFKLTVTADGQSEISDPGKPYVSVYNSTTGTYGPCTALPANGQTFVSLTMIKCSQGAAVIYLLDSAGWLYQIFQTSSNPPANPTWKWYGKVLSIYTESQFLWLTSGIGNGNNAQVILVGVDGFLYLLWDSYSQVNPCSWSWGILGPHDKTVIFTCAQLSKGTWGNLQMVGVATDGHAYLVWQDNSSGYWNWSGVLSTTTDEGIKENRNFEMVQTCETSADSMAVLLQDKNKKLYGMYLGKNAGWHYEGLVLVSKYADQQFKVPEITAYMLSPNAGYPYSFTPIANKLISVTQLGGGKEEITVEYYYLLNADGHMWFYVGYEPETVVFNK